MSKLDLKNIKWNEIDSNVLAGLIGFIGALVTVIITQLFTVNENSRGHEYVWEEKIVEKRISLIEDASTIFAEAGSARMMWREFEKDKNVSKVDLAKDLSKYQASYDKMLTLAKIFFGPLTRQAAIELDRNKELWWYGNYKVQQQLLNAMMVELKFGIDQIQ